MTTQSTPKVLREMLYRLHRSMCNYYVMHRLECPELWSSFIRNQLPRPERCSDVNVWSWTGLYTYQRWQKLFELEHEKDNNHWISNFSCKMTWLKAVLEILQPAWNSLLLQIENYYREMNLVLDQTSVEPVEISKK